MRFAPNIFSDEALFEGIARRVQNGEDYYAAAAAEQRAHGYPTKPAVTIREPTTAWLMAALRYDAARWAAILGLAAFAILAMHRAFVSQGMTALGRAVGMLAVAGGLDAGAPSAPYVSDVWAGLLICSALAVWRPGRYAASIALAFAACLFRELAAPALLAMTACALTERRWREAASWCAAAGAFGVLAAVHLRFASHQALASDLASQGWVRIGGWRFILLTARRNLALTLLPNPLVSIVVALAFFGLTRAPGPWGRRLATICFSFAALFWLTGRPDNRYWGTLYAPLLLVGLIYTPRLLRDLVPQRPLVFPRRRSPAT